MPWSSIYIKLAKGTIKKHVGVLLNKINELLKCT